MSNDGGPINLPAHLCSSTTSLSSNAKPTLPAKITRKMIFPTISPSESLNFPANFLGKCKTQPHIILRKKYFRCEPHHSLNSTAAFNDDNGSSSISKACTDEKVPESVSSINQKEWLHFVGIGGCGMSALAILALKQVNHKACLR